MTKAHDMQKQQFVGQALVPEQASLYFPTGVFCDFNIYSLREHLQK